MSATTPTLALLSTLLLCGCAESIYFTQPESDAAPAHGRFLMAYYTKVASKISVYVPYIDPTKKSVSVTTAVVSFPQQKADLYFNDNIWFNSSAEFATDEFGKPSKSDTSSTQQVTGILTDIGQTAGAVALMKVQTNPPTPTDTDNCVAALIGNSPTTLEFTPDGVTPQYTLISGTTASWLVDVTYPTLLGSKRSAVADPTAVTNGFYAYDPSPVEVSVKCTIGTRDVLYLPSAVVNAYMDSDRRLVEPKRNFFTARQDTFGLTNDIITDHKLVDQSAVKTVFDLLTTPIRSALPSTTTQSNTQVQTGGGKPDQTTQSTTVIVAPPHP